MMNSVHEQCPKSDSETVLSLKIGWVHQVHNLLTQQHTQVRTGGRAWSCRGAPQRRVAAWPPSRVAGQAVVSQALARKYRGLSLPCHGRKRHVAGLAMLYCDTTQPCLLLPGHNTPECIAIRWPSAQLLLVAIQLCVLQYNALPNLTLAPVTIHQVYCDTTSPAFASSATILLVYCNTLCLKPAPMSQYNNCIVTHLSHSQASFPATSQSQYTLVYCNTICCLQD